MKALTPCLASSDTIPVVILCCLVIVCEGKGLGSPPALSDIDGNRTGVFGYNRVVNAQNFFFGLLTRGQGFICALLFFFTGRHFQVAGFFHAKSEL